MKQPKTYSHHQLQALDVNERRRLKKLAQQARKSERSRTDPGHRPDSLESWMLRILEQEQGITERATMAGTVVWAGPQSCRVVLDGREEERESLVRRQRPVVGDRVRLISRAADNLEVAGIEPRRTKLSRPRVSDGGAEQVIVANVDTVVVVVSILTPPLHPRLIDRYLVAIQYGGAEATVVLNKIDLADAATRAEASALLAPYRAIGVPFFPVSTITGEGIEMLQGHLARKTAAFVGHSGVGKSALVNALYPEIGQKVGEVWQGYGRGTHTTTASDLFRLPDGGALIDTPGIRSFGIWNVPKEELRSYFPEFETCACRFRDCMHVAEPGCGVREAAETGDISSARYDAYLRLLE